MLIHLLGGQAQPKGYEPKYLDAKFPAELKEKESNTASIIS